MRRLVPAAAIAFAGCSLVTACRCGDGPSRAAGDAVSPPSAPALVYPEPVAIDGGALVRPAQLLRVPGAPRAAVAGLLDGEPALQVIDLERAALVWTERRWCRGALVHATSARLICADAATTVGVSADDGALVWRVERRFAAARGDWVAVDGALVSARDGRTRRELGSLPVRGAVVSLCTDGDRTELYAWSPGALQRLVAAPGEALRVAWSHALPGAPATVMGCGDPVVVEVPTAGAALRQFIAIDRASGARLAAREGFGLWPSAVAPASTGSGTGTGSGAGTGFELADAQGLWRVSRGLVTQQRLAPGGLALRVLASDGDRRVVRAIAGTLLAYDARAALGWLAGPAWPRLGALVGDRLLVAGWSSPDSAALRPRLFRLPLAPTGWPQPPAVRAPPLPPPPLAIPDPVGESVAPLQRFARADDRTRGVVAVAVAGTRVYAAAVGGERRAGVAAFDLASRSWRWLRADGCAAGAGVVALAASSELVVCGGRRADGSAAIVATGVDGRALWRAELGALDGLDVAPGVVIALVGDRAAVLDARSGRRLRWVAADHGHLPRLAATAGGVVVLRPGPRLVAASADGSQKLWSQAVSGVVTALVGGPRALLLERWDGTRRVVSLATGAPSPAPPAWPDATTVAAGDLWIDRRGTELRAIGDDGRARFRASLPAAFALGARTGGAAPVVVVIDEPPPRRRTLWLDPDTGAVIAALERPPAPAAPGAGFSAELDGEPVYGDVVAAPLTVRVRGVRPR